LSANCNFNRLRRADFVVSNVELLFPNVVINGGVQWSTQRSEIRVNIVMNLLNCRSFLVLAITLVCICAFRLSFTPKFQGRLPAKLGNGWKRSKSLSINSVLSAELGTKPTPGSPIVRYVYSNSNLALLTIAVSGEATRKAFNQACEIFNEVRLSLFITKEIATILTSHSSLFRIRRAGRCLDSPWVPSCRIRYCTISTRRNRSRMHASTSSTNPSR